MAKRKRNSGILNQSSESYDEIAKRIEGWQNKKTEQENYETYNESLKQYLPEWQQYFVDSWEFVHLCMAWEKLTREYNQENQHELGVKKHAFEFYCKQEGKKHDSIS